MIELNVEGGFVMVVVGNEIKIIILGLKLGIIYYIWVYVKNEYGLSYGFVK